MKLGLALQWAGKRIALPLQQIQLAESLGFDSLWAAEAYGTDAITPLAFVAAHTQRIRLATSVAQVSARTPAATAMAFNTLDQLAGEGRVICGLGLSGPQVVEGWYGQPWAQPYDRMKDTVAIMRAIWRRDKPVEYCGKAYSLPYPGQPGTTGHGKALKSIAATNPALPILLGTGSQSMVGLTAEVANGWIPFGFAPGDMKIYRPWLEAGFERAGRENPWQDFEIYVPCIVALTDDVSAELQRQKMQAAFYVGGMGHPQKNFHKDRMVRAGFADEAERVVELFAAGEHAQAAAAIPDEFIDRAALIGPASRIRQRLPAWEASGATGLALHGASDELLRLIADYFQG